MKSRRGPSSSSDISVVKRSRSRLRSISSGRPGSWIGTSPRSSDSTFSGTISRTTTRCPSSAKQAAVTRPTQPAPTTPIGCFSLMLASQELSRGSLGPRELAEALRDLQHVGVRNRLDVGIGEPEGALVSLPSDHPQAVPVVVELVVAIPDRLLVGRVVEDRR